MNKNDTPLKRAGVPALLSILMLCMMVAGGLHAQAVGDFMIPKKVNATGPSALKVWAGANSVLWGTDGSGEPGNVTVSGDFSIVGGELQWTGGASANVTGLDLLGAATASAARTVLGLGEAALATSTNTEGVGGPGLVLSRAEHTHNLGSPYITGTLPISKGGTGLVNTPTNGQLMIGSTTGNQWTRATLTQGNGITVTNGGGSITLAVNEAALTHNNIGGTLGVSKGGTGITSLSSGIATFLATATSINLRTALTDETGTGSAVFSIAPIFAQGTITAPDPALTISSTWNDSGDTMRGLEINVTNTASAGGSTPLRVTVGGSSYMEVTTDGSLRMLGGGGAVHRFRGDVFYGVDGTGNGQTGAFGPAYGFYVGAGLAYNINDQVYLRSGGSGVLALHNTTTAQRIDLYETRTDGSNYERLAISAAAGVNQVKPEAAGTGTASVVEYHLNASGLRVMQGSGAPEGVVTAPVGSLFLRTDGSTSTTLYVKTSGSGNTGWTAK